MFRSRRLEGSMCILPTAILVFLASLVTCVQGRAQAAPAAASSSPAWADPASWTKIKPVETDNIVFANVPLIPNPSANPDPGTPGGNRKPVPNTGAPGTKDLHIDVRSEERRVGKECRAR